MIQFILSVILELCGLYTVCNFHLIFTALQTSWSNSATNAGPFSDSMLGGNPNLGIMSQQELGHFLSFFRLGGVSFYLSSKSTYNYQQIFVSSAWVYLNEIHF